MEVPFASLIPFIIQLLFIAVAPLLFHHWWENNRNKLLVSIVLSLPVVLFMMSNYMLDNLEHQMLFDYLPFVILLSALFVITGGIHLNGDIQATPKANTIFLGLGYLLASAMGTTGAAMLLIRPILRINEQRKFKTHTVLFFIALVANCGGLLTPLGDPPLFLLYLRGAEFTWFIKLLPEWLFVGIVLLTIYYLLDRFYYMKKEEWTAISADMKEKTPITISGNINFVFIVGVVLSVAFINKQYIPSMADHHSPFYVQFLREIVLGVLIVLSLLMTPKGVRDKNRFTWTPILEVAALFLGIFATMTPALLYLNQHSASLGITTPAHFYYFTGILSAFLDNAPTALAFHSIAEGLPLIGTQVADISEILLKAISTAAVFFGAMTYIGNGPNFMVKAIAEDNKVPMPSFFGYIVKFSLLILLPVYILTQLLFL
ncbi:sodium:proton antiporter [Porphyromonadaceae bacterium COT-184 OH4590]|nr:sodium:proton antiporter [Porphyromonadaceae bacterium COT-184 OH4590]